MEATDGEGGVCEREKSWKKIVSATDDDWPLLFPVTVKFVGFELVAERPLTVRVLLSPAVIMGGLKLQVPVLHASVMLLTNELGAVGVIVNVAVLVPIRRTVDRTFAEREKTALPVPESETP